MVFIVKFNYSQKNGVLNQQTIAQLDNEDRDEVFDFVRFELPVDEDYQYIAVIEIFTGFHDYARPLEVYEWNEYFEVWAPVRYSDPVRNITLTYN